eukprot:4383370-Prymnesium_polylepis.1
MHTPPQAAVAARGCRRQGERVVCRRCAFWKNCCGCQAGVDGTGVRTTRCHAPGLASRSAAMCKMSSAQSIAFVPVTLSDATL